MSKLPKSFIDLYKKRKSLFEETNDSDARSDMFNDSPASDTKKAISDKARTKSRTYIVYSIISLALFLLVISIFVYQFNHVINRVAVVEDAATEKLSMAFKSLLELDFDSAKQSFFNAIGEYSQSSSVAGASWAGIEDILSKLRMQKTGALAKFNQMKKIGAMIAGAIDRAKFLQGNLFRLSTNNQGAEIVAALESVSDALKEVSAESLVSSQTFQMDDPLAIIFDSSRGALDALATWLKDPNGHNVLLIIQNDYDLKPSGGTIIGFINAFVKNANIVDIALIEQKDIANASKIISPIQLQSINPYLSAELANVFFNFPASAKKIVELSRQSRFVALNKINFDAAIAVNISVIKEILRIIGPIQARIGKDDIFVNSDNILTFLKKKSISMNDSKELFASILRILSSSSEDGLKRFWDLVFDGFIKKDTQLYFIEGAKNNSVGATAGVLQDAIKFLKISGEILDTSHYKNAFDYLAVVNTDVNQSSGEPERSQDISLESKIDPEGKIHNVLKIKNLYQYQQKSGPLTKGHKSYVEIYAPQDSRVLEKINISDAIAKKIYPKDAQFDSDIRGIEENGQYLGKTIFDGFVDDINKEIVVKYLLPRKLFLNNNVQYQFIFEKQSGLKGGLAYAIEAPAGFYWLESQGQIFTYSIDSLPARVILNLTLKADQR